MANLKSDLDKLDIDKLENVPSNLSNLKSKVDTLDVDKVVPVPVDLSKLGDAVKNNVVKKTECDELVKKVNVIKTTDTSNLIKKLIITQKLMKLKRKLLIIIMIDTLLLKNFNKLTGDNFTARLAQANLASKSDIVNFIKKDRL